MALEKRSMMIATLLLAFIALSLGLLEFAVDISGWGASIIALGLALILWMEAGIRMSLKGLRPMSVVAGVVGLVLFINAVLNLPVLSLDIDVLNIVNGVAYVLAGVALLLEAFDDAL